MYLCPVQKVLLILLTVGYNNTTRKGKRCSHECETAGFIIGRKEDAVEGRIVP